MSIFSTYPAAPLQLDTQGNLLVNVNAGGGSGGTAAVDEAAFTEGTTSFTPIGGEFRTSPTALTSGQAGAACLTANRGLHVNPRNSSGTEIATLSNPYRIDPTGTTTQPVSGTVSIAPATSGGVSSSKLVSAASTNATSVKGSAGQLYSAQVFNLNAAARYLKLYDKASAPTVGTDTPVATWLIPPSSSGFTVALSVGMVFTLGIAFALTTGITDADTGAVAASEILVNLQYK